MPIKLNSASGGSVTLDVPATGSTFNLTVPANNATLFTDTGGTITGNVSVTGSVATDQWKTSGGILNYGVVQAMHFPALTTRNYNITTVRTTWTTVRTTIISPRSANNTLVFSAKWNVYFNSETSALSFRILRSDGTVLQSSDDYMTYAGDSSAKGENSHDPYKDGATFGVMLTGGSLRFDRPNTTSPVTYYWQFTKEDNTRADIELGHNSNYNCWGMVHEYQGLPA